MKKMGRVVNPSLYSISGFRRAGKTSVFNAVRKLFRERHPELPVTFLHHVLGERPHPLEWTPEERKIHTTTRLFYGWARLNEVTLKVLDFLAKGHIVFVDEFGLDVYLEAIACKDCAQQKQEAFQLHHHHLVPARIVTQGLRPPLYFIPRVWTGPIDGGDEFHATIEREIDRYFDNTGQRSPVFLGGKTVKECAEEVYDYVLRGLQQAPH